MSEPPPDRIVRVSSAGLVRCPACDAHVRLDATCDLCGAAIAPAAEARSTLRRLTSRGRGGVIAAALFGMSLGAACPSTPPRRADEPPARQNPEPEPDAGTSPDAEPVPTPAPAYGIAPRPAPDPEPQPDYGLPPSEDPFSP